MRNLDSISITYNAGAVFVSLLLSMALILTLTWPAAAEIPLSICIFIQLMAFSGYMHEFLQEAESMIKVYALLREGSADSQSRRN